MTTIRTTLSLIAAALLAACSGNPTQPAAPARLADGVLVGGNGMTLYTFDKDAAGGGKSACNGPCATNWPPLFAIDGAAGGTAGGADYSVIMRDDGKKQWAFKGKPLYYWAKDQKSGDRTGDGFNNVWHVAKP
jgi:predicted lipoprotein with Yx(FWY)xxD motif